MIPDMEAALHRLDIQPGHTTEAELTQDDAKILPALVNGQTPNLAFENITASGAGKILESTHS